MDWTRGPPVLVGEKVLWSKICFNKPKSGVIKWIGNISEISSDWCVGIELDKKIPNIGGDGFWKGRKLFDCHPGHGVLVPIEEIQKFSSKIHSRPISVDNYSHLKLNGTQEDFNRLDQLNTRNKENHSKKKYFSDNRKSKDFINGKEPDFKLSENENRKSELGTSSEPSPNFIKKNNQEGKKSQQRASVERKNSSQINSDFEALKKLQTLDSRTSVTEFIKNMNEIAGYFKEIKEGDETYESQQRNTMSTSYDANESGHSKPKKLFSFLKWFNKKHKNEPNIKLYQNSSVASSPIFPRKETSSCESIDTIFSTQTVRSFAYIPPTQYMPSAPPLEYDRASHEQMIGDLTLQKIKSEETEPVYDRRKKRKAPEPPRLSRENSLPTTLEFKKPQEDFDGIKTYHRRTVSESFKDKKAGAYCHVQGKRKAPPPPAPLLYPNLQKVNNQYQSLSRKKKPAPPPPESTSGNQTQETGKDVKNQNISPKVEPKIKNSKDLTEIEIEEKGMKINQKSKERLTKDVSLSPLPSRPWYKRSNRDSTGNNIIKKDFLRGFDKKTNKETDDWMPEVGFHKRSPSVESSHSKFNIFSKLDKSEEKKKEEKRKSQISILTNISELDREAAEIVKKEQAQEKKMLAANDAKFYSTNEDKISEFTDKLINMPESFKNNNFSDNKSKVGTKSQGATIAQVQPTSNNNNVKDERTLKDIEDKLPKSEPEKENNLSITDQSKNSPKPNLHSPNIPKSSSDSSSQTPKSTSSQARLNFFNVQNKETNYLNEPWVCQKCTLENPGWRVFCEICRSVKPMFSSINSPRASELDKKEFEKETNKLEPVPVQNDKPKPEETEPKLQKAEQNNTEKTEGTPTESLDELRKKRMMFFTPKLDELEKTESDSNETKLKNFVKDMRESLPKEEQKSKEEADKKELKEENKKEIKAKSEEKLIPDSMNEKNDKREEPRKSQNQNEKPEKSLIQREPSQSKEDNTKPSSSNPTEEVAEAYIITKTIVLEDIIVQRPDRARKATGVQTKASILKSPETKAIRPPPRTKRTNSGNIIEDAKETEPNSSFEKENYKPEDLEELTTKLTQAQGLADFRANIETMPPNTEMNTVAVNRLLRKLETAINNGDHFVAAGLAKELALMKINCSVTRQVTPTPSTSTITADLYIEDKVSHQGPIPLKVSPAMTVLQLKKKVQEDFGIPLEVQRWILDKKLTTDDNKTLEAEGVRTDYCPLFLYLVAPGNRQNTSKPNPEKTPESEPNQNTQLSKEKPKIKGWYYNDEEDHYSYCEDSEEDSDTSPQDLRNHTKSSPPKEVKTEVPQKDLKNIETNQKINLEEKKPVFDLKIKEDENSPDKELKFIPMNSVRQKVEQLNRTFAENAKVTKPSRSSGSPEKWKCNTCNVVNLSENLNCASCRGKRVPTGLNNVKTEPIKNDLVKKENRNLKEITNDNYKALIELQDADLVPNSEPFNCTICMEDYEPGKGVILKDCLHTFCRTCLVSTVQFSEDAEVKCPYFDDTYSCQSVLQQREIKALVPQKIFEKHLAKSVKEAENKMENAFHCKSPDCKGWCIFEDNVNEFRCPVCKATNCLTCQAIHTGINCRQYQEKMKLDSETDADANKTRNMLNEMVEKGEAMVCPKCQVVLMKKWGCDWLRCSMCKTEICWVTRGFRWGPEGKGDTSGGCKCGVNGVKCHPKCNYCH